MELFASLDRLSGFVEKPLDRFGWYAVEIGNL
jgi:hypothetical protein